MAVYHYKNSALIERIDVTSPRTGIAQATIIAAAKTSRDEMEELRAKLGKQKFSTMMDTVDGRAAIQVRGLKDEQAFVDAMERLDLAHDGVEKDLVQDPEPKVGFGERVRGKSLFLSALFYDIGNIALIISGIQRGRHNKGGFTPNDFSELSTGLAFSLGDVLMTFYGHERDDAELSAAAQGLKRHLHQKGIEIPQGDALTAESLNDSGAMKATDRWLRKHIGHVKCLTELAGGLFMIHSGLKRDQLTQNINRYKITAGSLIATAWASTFLLEKPRGHQVFDNGKAPENLVDKVKDNPRAWIAAPLAMANNVSNLLGANQERSKGLEAIAKLKNSGNRKELAFAEAKQHDYLWNVLTACSFLVAHTLFGMSGSKRPRETEDDKRVMQDLVLLAANVLARQSEPVREASLEETAEYVSKLAHVSLSKEQVAEAIREKLASLDQCAWTARVAQTPSAAVSPSV